MSTVLSTHGDPAPQIRSTILALYKLVCMYVCSANLECRSEMCGTRLAENTRRKKSSKIRHRRFGSLWHPSKFQRVSRLAFVTAAKSLNGP